MGKWTADYFDDVLGSKMKSLVQGAVKRSKLEKAEPTISYETFVEDLDPGDSFTTSLIEILVKELSERRQRHTIADKRLISDRTSKSLHLLTVPQRIYRDRGGMRGLMSRRSLNLAEYLAVPPEEMDVDDDNDSLDSVLDLPGAVEGARMNAELYDAYSVVPPHDASSSTSRAPRVRQHGMVRLTEDEMLREMHARYPQTAPTGPAYSGSTLSSGSVYPPRQATTRRPPVRSRTVDFNDFTSRRRSSTRENTAGADEAPSSRPADGSVQASAERRGMLSSLSNPSASVGNVPRRFFQPFRRPEMSIPWTMSPEPAEHPHPAASQMSNTERERTYLSWLSHTPAPQPQPAAPRVSPPSTVEHRDSESDRASPAPETGPRPATHRLRRGGVRPPESLLLRHVPTESGELYSHSRYSVPRPIHVYPMADDAASGAEDQIESEQGAVQGYENAGDYGEDASRYST